MRQKGTPTYTQHTVAWPHRPPFDRHTEEINVNFKARGGGTHGEFMITFQELSGNICPRVECFTDGLRSLLDERTLTVLNELRRREERGVRSITPADVVTLLEEAGFRPSRYQLSGLLSGGNVPYDERARINKLIVAANRREGS